MEWKMHHWKDLAKLCKVTSNEHHENWTPMAPKQFEKKNEGKSQKKKIID